MTVFSVAPRIIGLLFTSSPFAVFGAIVSIIVYPLKRIARWGFAHIFKEVFKQFPSLTHFNSSATPAVKIFRVGIVAPLIHSAPCIVNGCSGHTVSPRAVPDIVFAPTTRGTSIDVGLSNGFFGAAVATAKKISVLSSALYFLKYCPHSVISETRYGSVTYTGYGT